MKLVVLCAFLAARSFCQDCNIYGSTTTLRGSLWLKDESGYNQFIVLKLIQPICTVRGPRDTADEYSRRRNGVTEIQAGVNGSDAASGRVRERLDRLVGQRVTIKGVLFPATTGYHRTEVQLSVESVDAADMAGQRALLAPILPCRASDVAAYEVIVNAGRRLVIEAREIGTGTLLGPPDQYAPHLMTGGEGMYIDCREGYQRKLISTTEANGGACADLDLCGFSAFPTTPVTIKFRCVKVQ